MMKQYKREKRLEALFGEDELPAMNGMQVFLNNIQIYFIKRRNTISISPFHKTYKVLVLHSL